MSRFSSLGVALLLMVISPAAISQDIRYSWFEISYAGQDVDKDGTFADLALGQTVDISTQDGDGIKFRGSLGTWKNLFTFIDFSSTDIDVDALVSNALGQASASDEFDFTSVRGGVGLRWSLNPKTDVYGAISYDSTDLDFGSFAGENFDTDDKDIGASVGVRHLIRPQLELRASVRYSGVGDVELTTGEFDSDTLFSAGFGYELVRGLSITGDYETGEFSNWNIGFRLDLDED